MDIRSFLIEAPKTSRLSRRAMLRAAGCGFGYLGLQSLLAEVAMAAPSDDPLVPKSPMFPARAKRVIFLFMHGGPSSHRHLRPQALPRRQRRQAAAHQAAAHLRRQRPGGLMKSPWQFKNCGQSGLPISDLFPNIRECADDLCAGPLHGRRRRGPWRRAASDLYRHLHVHASQRGLLGALRAWFAKTEICPATSPSSRRSLTAARRTGPPAFYPARCKARLSATPACKSTKSRRSPSSISSTRGSPANSSGMNST